MKTLFVVGAGASAELNFPDGEKLKSVISTALNLELDVFDRYSGSGDRLIFDALSRQKEYGLGAALDACHQIRRALPFSGSIDACIDKFRGNSAIELAGKLAIAREILRAEESAWIGSDAKSTNMGALGNKEAWHARFFQVLTDGCRADELADRFEQVTFVIFNYDRSVEQFMYLALQQAYGLQENDAANLISRISFYHPYGKVGRLPWEAGSSEAKGFGQEIHHSSKLYSVSKMIRTFAEGSDPESSNIEDIRPAIATAERIVFLGFAFHIPNMQLILPQSIEVGPRAQIFSTAFKVSHYNRESISSMLTGAFPRKSGLNFSSRDQTCFDFFEHFRNGLVFHSVRSTRSTERE